MTRKNWYKLRDIADTLHMCSNMRGNGLKSKITCERVVGFKEEQLETGCVATGCFISTNLFQLVLVSSGVPVGYQTSLQSLI